jgi:hypothetical protein
VNRINKMLLARRNVMLHLVSDVVEYPDWSCISVLRNRKKEDANP